MGVPPLISEEEFWDRVDVGEPDACWPWKRGRHTGGYGVIGRKKPVRVTAYAHRLAYDFAHGEIPEGREVRHACDNPPCCNPAHLSVGERADNVHDMLDRGRHYTPFTAKERARHGFAAGGPCR